METETRGDPSPREFYAPWRGTTVNEFYLVVGDRRFPIRELRNLQPQRGPMQTTFRAVLGVIFAQAVVVAVALAALARLDTVSAVLWTIGVVQALATTALIGLSAVRWPPHDELWATVRGRDTLLFSCADRIEFNKVHRAVVRAITVARDNQRGW